MSRLVILFLGLLIFTIYCSHLFMMNVDETVKHMETNYTLKVYLRFNNSKNKNNKYDTINNKENKYDNNSRNKYNSYEYNHDHRKNILSCQELFTTPILTRVMKNKLEYQHSFQNLRSSFTRKTITKGNPPFTFSPYEALARTLPPLIT
ncbi:unnamed protein product, partial [Meganyctiphanes norvegica]